MDNEALLKLAAEAKRLRRIKPSRIKAEELKALKRGVFELKDCKFWWDMDPNVAHILTGAPDRYYLYNAVATAAHRLMLDKDPKYDSTFSTLLFDLMVLLVECYVAGVDAEDEDEDDE